ncbi:MAG: response regulator [Bacteroidales bacterium]|nr:response regulator [Bacteroidales bacterium]
MRQGYIKEILALTVLLIIISTRLSAIDVIFNTISTNNGLSNFSALTVYEDERGLIWIGTRDGLNLYNGNYVEVFKAEKGNKNSLINNYVKDIIGNNDGKIFIRCTEGISEYNYKLNKFTTLYYGDVSSIYFDKNLFLTFNNIISVYSEDTKSFNKFYELPDKNAKISCLFKSGNTLWIGTHNQGLYLLEANRFFHKLPKGDINSIFQDSKGQFWVASADLGLFRINQNEISNFKNNSTNTNSICSNFVRSCTEDNNGNIWIGTFNGLCRFNQSTNTFTSFFEDKSSGGLSSSSIWGIIKDKQGNIWCGTYYGGVNYFNPEYQIYTQYGPSETEGAGLSISIVGKMTEDKFGNLWICTDGGGLNIYNPKLNTYRWYKKSNSPKNSISHNNVTTLYYDSVQEIMWIGTHLGGLNKFDIKSEVFTHYFFIAEDSATLSSNIIYDILPFNDELIVATQNGVFLFNRENGKSERLFKSNNDNHKINVVVDIFLDQKGILWMSVDKGIASYNFDNRELKFYKQVDGCTNCLSSNSVNTIFEDSKHNLWFGTLGGGLDRYRYETDDFENFDMKSNNLPGNSIYCISEFNNGELILLTDNGLASFNIKTQSSKNYKLDINSPLRGINENAFYLKSNGEIFIGGVEGMVSFNLKDLEFPRKPYEILLHKLYVNGSEVTVGDKNSILSKALNYTSKIVLNSKQHVFSIEYALSNYMPSKTPEIIYKLEGFSDNWTEARENQSITYTNLNPGTYKLHIKAKERIGDYLPERTIDIKVLPPFYKTKLAYLIYILILASIIYYLLYLNNKRIKLQESLKYEEKHIRDLEELNETKLRFFTDISHEFRTPLSLIIGQIETVLQQQNIAPFIYKKILIVYKSSLQMKDLISELLDFRKQIKGHMKIQVSEHDMVEFLSENYLLFLEYASKKKLNFTFNKEAEQIRVWYDHNQMQKVINNLLSNAFNYSKEGGTIILSIAHDDKYVKVQVNDNGVGIPPEDLDRIFDRFYQVNKDPKRAAFGTGIGLALTKGIIELHHGNIAVESNPEKGTTFTIILPLGNSHFSKNDFSNTEELSEKAEYPIEAEAMNDSVLNTQAEYPQTKSAAKILIVEDNDSVREMLVSLFKPYYSVITACNGEEAHDLVVKEFPEIVLSDVLMPKMSGTELCKHIKRDPVTCHIPVVLLTARAAIEHNLEGLRIGADDYITKPFNTSILVSRCNNLVNSRKMLQEKFSKQPQVNHQMLATNEFDKVLLDKIMKIVDLHLGDPGFKIENFSNEMGMSRTNLFTKIKAVTGQTPIDFINTIRLKRAAIMLKNNPELNVTEISETLGFSSARYFSRCFKNKFSTSPMSYRTDRSS